MKREELMINDIVFDYTNSPVKVCAVGQDIVVKNSFGVGSLDPNELSPIPLSEEILVKNGFALDKTLAVIGTKVYTRPCPAGDLSVKVFHDGSIRFGFIKLNYVHQLQHLLRLCGIEKEIEL